MKDIALETHSKDWVFDGNRDLMMVDGEVWLYQRIMIRLLVPVGIYTFDASEIIGSELHTMLRTTGNRALVDLPLLVQEALGRMNDIVLEDVGVEMTDEGRTAMITIQFHPAALEDDVFTTEIVPESQTATFEIT